MNSRFFQDNCKKYGIALTGGAATGKSAIGKMIQEAGFIVIDADKLARKLSSNPQEKVWKEIVQTFGKKILDKTGHIDRSVLAKIIFSDAHKKKSLEAIMHPAIRDKLSEHILSLKKEEQKKPWFYEASLVFEAKIQDQFKEVWLTICSEERQRKRLLTRPGYSEEKVKNMMKSQIPTEEKKQLADILINTDGSLDETKMIITQELAKLKENFALKKNEHRKN